MDDGTTKRGRGRPKGRTAQARNLSISDEDWAWLSRPPGASKNLRSLIAKEGGAVTTEFTEDVFKGAFWRQRWVKPGPTVLEGYEIGVHSLFSDQEISWVWSRVHEYFVNHVDLISRVVKLPVPELSGRIAGFIGYPLRSLRENQPTPEVLRNVIASLTVMTMATLDLTWRECSKFFVEGDEIDQRDLLPKVQRSISTACPTIGEHMEYPEVTGLLAEDTLILSYWMGEGQEIDSDQSMLGLRGLATDLLALACRLRKESVRG